jgi:tetratricopeptide (TPR) repeat protein
MDQATAKETATVGDALINARQLLQTHPDAAAQQARAIIMAEPGIAESYLILAVALRRLGRFDDAELAEAQGIRVSHSDEVLKRAANMLASGRSSDAEELVRLYIMDTPNDPLALCMFSEIAADADQLEFAEQLLWRSLALAPGFDRARASFDVLLKKQALAFRHGSEKPLEPPASEAEFKSALELNERAISDTPENATVWLSYGNALRLAGRQDECIAAYRRAVDLKPTCSEAWWGLADLKIPSLGESDRQVMLGQLKISKLPEPNRIGINFALGKALDDAGEHELAFRHYETGNALRRKSILYDVAHTIHHVKQCEARFTSQFLSSRRGQGHPANDPIFIVGMPRSGSTLVEQILASHPSIEGSEELVYFGNIASFLSGGRRAGLDPSDFVDIVSALVDDKLETIGGAYLWQASRKRRSSRPRFIDKMPRNWLYLPLIRLALPNAKIVDVRRNAMDCCWSNFRQLFADSGEYSYDLTELGQYYWAYVDMLNHFDAVDPGAVHRVDYEQLVDEPEAEIRRLLDYLNLPFDPACLEFHRNPRAVKTASSEQVRQPINRSGIGQWRPYGQWLGPLKQALGSLADR